MAKGNEHSGTSASEYWIESDPSASVEVLFVSLQYDRLTDAFFFFLLFLLDFSQDFLRQKRLKRLGSNPKGHF